MFDHPITSKITGIVLYLVVALILGWLGFFFGLIVAVMTPSQIGGVYVVIGMSMTQFMLSGGIWPLDGQQKLLVALSEFLPTRLASKMMNNISYKDWTLDNPSIAFGIATMLSYIAIIILVLIVMGKYKKDLWAIQK